MHKIEDRIYKLYFQMLVNPVLNLVHPVYVFAFNCA